MRITPSRLHSIQADSTALVSIDEAAVFLQRRPHQVLHLCHRGVLPLARSTDGEIFAISDHRLTIEVSVLRKTLSTVEEQALDLWLRGAADTPAEAMAAIRGGAVIAQSERNRERSAPAGAL